MCTRQKTNLQWLLRLNVQFHICQWRRQTQMERISYTVVSFAHILLGNRRSICFFRDVSLCKIKASEKNTKFHVRKMKRQNDTKMNSTWKVKKIVFSNEIMSLPTDLWQNALFWMRYDAILMAFKLRVNFLLRHLGTRHIYTISMIHLFFYERVCSVYGINYTEKIRIGFFKANKLFVSSRMNVWNWKMEIVCRCMW